MTTADSRVFVDTNILVYSTFQGSPFYPAARKRLHELRSVGAPLWTSRQVLREYLAVTTRPKSGFSGPPLDALTEGVRLMEGQFTVADEDAAVTAILLDLVNSRGVRGTQIHGANIIATMRCHGISLLLTHNRADFIRYSPEITVLPLLPE